MFYSIFSKATEALEDGDSFTSGHISVLYVNYIPIAMDGNIFVVNFYQENSLL